MFQKTILFTRMGMRNAVKYGRRNILVVLVTATGVGAIAVFSALTRGFITDVTARFIETTSHARIFAEDYYRKRELMPLDKHIDGWRKTAADITALRKGTRVSGCITGGAFVSTGDKSYALMVTGIEPFDTVEGEPSLFPSYRKYASSIIKGTFFKSNAMKAAILGTDAASRIGAEIGDTVILFASDSYGSFQGIELPLAGIMRLNEQEADANLCLIDLADMQYLLGLDGAVNEIPVFTDNVRTIGELKTALAPLLISNRLEMRTWRELIGSYMYAFDLFNSIMLIIYIIFFTVASVGITNIVLITVMNRIRDIGTMRALGFLNSEIARMILAEELIIGLAGSLLGLAAAAPVCFYLQVHGIIMPSEVTDFVAMTPGVLRALTVPSDIIAALICGSLIPPLASIYPVLVIRKISVTKALSRS